jgi:hypothetical protein
MANINHPVLANSTIIDLKGRKVGTEDLMEAAKLLTWAEQSGYRGNDISVAEGLVIGLGKAVELSEEGRHEAASKQAGNVLYVLRKNKESAEKTNRRSLGSLEIGCRDGQVRKLGNIVEYFMNVHGRIHEQIEAAKASEAAAEKEDEAQMLQLVEALKEGREVKAA